MKLFIVLTVSALFISTYGASVADVYDGRTNDGTSKFHNEEGTKNEIDVFGLSETNNEEGLSGRSGLRARRFTCDVMSFQSQWFTPNDSGCALHCIQLRRQGGKCKNGICVCRGKKW